MVYAYCRKAVKDDSSTSDIKKWTKDNNAKIDEFVWDDDVRAKTSFEKRQLGLYLLPKMQDGDTLVVTELSCLGRSVVELDRFFNGINKKIRVVCTSMSLDINYGDLSPTQNLLLEKISFAANLQKQIVKETTKAALETKRKGGIKLGGASDKWKASRESKTKEELSLESMKRGLAHSKKHLLKPESVALLNILKNVFGLDDEISSWNIKQVTTKGDYKFIMLDMIKDYQEHENLFHSWNLSDLENPILHQKLRSTIHAIFRSVNNYLSKSNYEKKILLNRDSSNVVKKEGEMPGHRLKQNSNKITKEDVSLDRSKLSKIEKDTDVSHSLLSVIFSSDESVEENIKTLPEDVFVILNQLLSKEIWSHKEVYDMCKSHNLIMGAVLEQINNYSIEVTEDTVLDEDDDYIYVTTEYKKYLI